MAPPGPQFRPTEGRIAGPNGAGGAVGTRVASQPALTIQSGFDAAKGGLDIPPERELAPVG